MGSNHKGNPQQIQLLCFRSFTQSDTPVLLDNITEVKIINNCDL
jgi:hypothetical protein